MAGPSILDWSQSTPTFYEDEADDPETRTISLPLFNGTATGDYILACAIGDTAVDIVKPSVDWQDLGGANATDGVYPIYVAFWYYQIPASPPATVDFEGVKIVSMASVNMGDQADRFDGWGSYPEFYLPAGVKVAGIYDTDGPAWRGSGWESQGGELTGTEPDTTVVLEFFGARTMVRLLPSGAPDPKPYYLNMGMTEIGGSAAGYTDRQSSDLGYGEEAAWELRLRSRADMPVGSGSTKPDSTFADELTTYDVLGDPVRTAWLLWVTPMGAAWYPKFSEPVVDVITDPSVNKVPPLKAQEVRITELPYNIQSGMLGSRILGTERRGRT